MNGDTARFSPNNPDHSIMAETCFWRFLIFCKKCRNILGKLNRYLESWVFLWPPCENRMSGKALDVQKKRLEWLWLMRFPPFEWSMIDFARFHHFGASDRPDIAYDASTEGCQRIDNAAMSNLHDWLCIISIIIREIWVSSVENGWLKITRENGREETWKEGKKVRREKGKM